MRLDGLDALLSHDLVHSRDITIAVRERADGMRGDLILPLHWARILNLPYELMSDERSARIRASKVK